MNAKKPVEFKVGDYIKFHGSVGTTFTTSKNPSQIVGRVSCVDGFGIEANILNDPDAFYPKEDFIFFKHEFHTIRKITKREARKIINGAK